MVEEKSSRRIRKEKTRAKFAACLNEYSNALICHIDNVGSSQMQAIRISLRGKAVVCIGKNTLLRKVIREEAEKNPKLLSLLPYVVGNVGFVFTNGDVREIRKLVAENKVPAAAKAGSIATLDVTIPAGPTSLDPSQTAFFQTLNIATKIAKGAIEIVNDVKFIKIGDKVTSSHVVLLGKLNIRPFFYGAEVQSVYEDGVMYDASVLDLTPADMMGKFFNGVRKLAAISLASGYPTLASLPHTVAGAFKKLLALSFAVDYEFDLAKQIKEKMASGAFVSAAAPAASAGAAPAAAAAAAEPEPEEESEAEMGFGLFD